MSPGLQWINQFDLPHTIENDSYKCPVCRRNLVIKGISQWETDGRVPNIGLQIVCKSVPEHSQERIREWGTVNIEVGKWFNSFYRYHHLTPEEERKQKQKNRRKWRRLA